MNDSMKKLYHDILVLNFKVEMVMSYNNIYMIRTFDYFGDKKIEMRTYLLFHGRTMHRSWDDAMR